MNRLISWLRQTLIIFLVAISVFVFQDFGYGRLAQAEPVTPEARSYQAAGDRTTQIERDNQFVEKPISNLKEAAENIKEKLNLDEPIDPGTKEFFNSTKEKAAKAVKPTGKEQGSSQR
jgi:hypothetical protein